MGKQNVGSNENAHFALYSNMLKEPEPQWHAEVKSVIKWEDAR